MPKRNTSRLSIAKSLLLLTSAALLTACASDVQNTKAKKDVSYDTDTIEEVVVTGTRQQESKRVRRLNERNQVAGAPPPKLSSPMIMANSGVVLHDANDPYLPTGNEKYADVEESAIKLVEEDPVSTFSIDVDTGSYTNVRRMLNGGHLPPADAVRVEEFINYFDYNYKTPRNTKEPFLVNTELSQTPWNKDSMLLKVGLKAYEVDQSERPDANLVFLLDVSGSMNSANKLPLLKKSFRMLTKNLNKNDSVSIVVYAGASGVVLEPTPGNEKREILRALSRLRAGGSTNGAAGIQLAYQMAEEAFIEDGINRIIIATDGDFNVGTSGTDALKRLIEDKREKGISLTTLGFGSGNYNDHLMEQLADVGNGNHAYIDSVREAEKVLVTEMSSTLLTVAKDVKIQVEFNPSTVSEYRLIGYENRALKREDFNNDKVDAGEIGAGHTVTALYEIFPTGTSNNVDPLRYGSVGKVVKGTIPNELAFVKLRFKYPDAEKSTLREFAVAKSQQRSFRRTSRDFKFATAVSAFGQKLKRSKYIGDYQFEDILELAEDNVGKDRHGYREEFVELVEVASELMGDEHYVSETN